MLENKTSTFDYSGFEVAIIGMSGKFPDAEDISELWNNLKSGKESVITHTEKEILESDVNKELLTNSNFINKSVKPINGKEFFDNSFFGFTAKEAAIMDPQIRLLHEYVWHALEDAGYTNKRNELTLGLFAGAASNMLWELQTMLQNSGAFTNYIYSNKDFISTQVSHSLNLTGPSITLNTACSTSLVAIHMAYQSILNGECDIAIAAGVNIKYEDKKGYAYQDGMILSRDGHNRTFDERATGTIGGEGLGVIVLKKLENAIEDNDNIYSIIKGSAINNDGNRKVGYTAPSVNGQIEIIKTCHQVAEVEPDSIGYVEAHGTATELGDVVEFDALKSAFNSDKKAFCALGSIKTNIGHLNTAAGIAGFIKSALVLKNKQIPPSLHFEVPNSKFNIIDSPFYVNNELSDFISDTYPLRAAVSAFGIGGTNVHAILEEFNYNKPHPSSDKCYCVAISAKTKEALEEMENNISRFVEINRSIRIQDIAYTLNLRRDEFQFRKFITCKSTEQITKERFQKCRITKVEPDTKTLFCFSDISNLSLNKELITELYDNNSIFKRILNDLCASISQESGHNIFELIQSNNGNIHSGQHQSNELVESEILGHFAIQIGLALFLIELNIIPEMLVGQGIGEILAVCMTESISISEGIELVKRYSKSKESNDLSSLLSLVGSQDFKRSKKKFYSVSSACTVEDTQFYSLKYWERLFNNDKNECEYFASEAKGLFAVNFGNENILKNYDIENISLFSNKSQEDFDIFQFHEKINGIWAKGISIAWDKLYCFNDSQCITLPFYPFEQRKFMADINELKSSLKNREQKSFDNINEMEECVYVPIWKERNTKLLPSLKISSNTNCLVFIHELNLCKLVISELEKQGYNLIKVYIGSRYEKNNNFEYTINPCIENHYEVLISEIEKDNLAPSQIFHLWSLEDLKAITSIANEDIQEKNYYSILRLSREIIKRWSHIKTKFFVLTNNLYRVFYEEELYLPQRATIIGACKVISTESSSINSKCIDIDLTENIDENYISTLINRLLKKESDDNLEVLRKNKYFIEDYEQVSLPVSIENNTFKDNGVYLITGGLGGIGKELALHIAKFQGVKLILVGRTKLPEKSNWENWLSNHQGDDLISEKIKLIKKIEKSGAQVLYFNVDISNNLLLNEIVQKSVEYFGKINGILHCAGKPDGVLIRNRTKEISEDIFSSKYYGTIELCELFKERSPEFIILFSSLNSIIGIPGQAGYTAANLFLDRYADYMKSKSGLNIKSVNWDQWTNIGMAKVVKQMHEIRNQVELVGFTAHKAIKLQESITFLDSSQIVISAKNINRRRLKKHNLNVNESLEKDKDKRKQVTYDERPKLSNELVLPTNDVELKLANLLQTYLGIKEVGIRDNFFELGVKSLDIIQLAIEVKNLFSKNISVVDMYTYSSIEKLSSYLLCQESNTSFNSMEKSRIEKKDSDSRIKLKKRGNLKNISS